MAIELAQRLMHADVVARHDIEHALLRYAKHGVPFLHALLEGRPQMVDVLEWELQRLTGPALQNTPPYRELMARLPAGLCSRLLGFPIGFTPSTGVVDVLVADPTDGHARAEFGFHLRAPVRALRGSLKYITDQLIELEGELAPKTARQDGTKMNDASDRSSIKPIPLVRLAPDAISDPPATSPGIAPLSKPSTRPPATARGVAPAAMPASLPRPAPAHPIVEPPMLDVGERTPLVVYSVDKTSPGVAPSNGEAGHTLIVARGENPAAQPAQPEAQEEQTQETEPGVAPPSSQGASGPPRVVVQQQHTSPGVAPPSSSNGAVGPPKVVVHAPKSIEPGSGGPPAVSSSNAPLGMEAGSSSLTPESAELRPTDPEHADERTIISTDEQSFQTALSELAVAEKPDDVVDAMVLGLGAMCQEVVVSAVRGNSLKTRARTDPEGNAERFTDVEVIAEAGSGLAEAIETGQYLGPAKAGDRELFFSTQSELCATRVLVAGRPTLMLSASGFTNSFEVTRRSDHLCRAASDALGRILLARKR